MLSSKPLFRMNSHSGKKQGCSEPNFKLVSIFFLILLIYISNVIPFLGFPSANPLSHSPYSASIRVLLHPPTHSCLTALAFLYTKASILQRTKGLLSHWCQIRPLQLLQSFPKLLHWGPWAQFNSWLWAYASVLVRIWQSLSGNSCIRLLSASTSWHQQQCLGLVTVYAQVGQSLNGISFSLCSTLCFHMSYPSAMLHLSWSTVVALLGSTRDIVLWVLLIVFLCWHIGICVWDDWNSRYWYLVLTLLTLWGLASVVLSGSFWDPVKCSHWGLGLNVFLGIWN
jgi:hypothetical protein